MLVYCDTIVGILIKQCCDVKERRRSDSPTDQLYILCGLFAWKDDIQGLLCALSHVGIPNVSFACDKF